VPTISPNRHHRPTSFLIFGLLLCAGCGSGTGSHRSATATTGAQASTSTTEDGRPAVTDSAQPSRSSGPLPAVTASPAGEACVQQAYAGMSSAQRAGQLVMTGVPIGDPAAQRTLVRTKHLGGVFLAGRSSHSPATVRTGVARLTGQKTANATIGLLVATDQEGGQVQSLSGGSWTAIPTATVQATWSTAKLTSRTTSWVKQLKIAGVNMDLAPVADTVPAGSAAENPPIGHFSRQYGSTSTGVAAKITTVTSAMAAAKVIPTVKHFPGLGRVRYNTDTSTKAVDSKTTVTDPYLRPFQAGIDAGAGAVMISSASYPKLDPNHPAVFSSAVITDLLRTRMKYPGVVTTDDVGRAVAVKSVPVGQRATRFIAAGGDLVLTVTPSTAPTMVKAVAAKAASSSTFRAQVQASVLRVLRLKQTSGLLTCS
jgi:beta-N-acetylhexosaminidase